MFLSDLQDRRSSSAASAYEERLRLNFFDSFEFLEVPVRRKLFMAWRTQLQVGMSQIRLLNHPRGRGLVALLTRSGYYTRRASGGSSSQVLNEEKRAAAEAVYIKNLEQEKLATLSQKGLTSEEARARLASVSPTASPQVAKAAKVSTDTEKNIAVVSGIIAIISTTCLYLMSSSSSKKDTDDEEY